MRTQLFRSALVLLLLLPLLAACEGDHSGLRAREGVLDLSAWNFAARGAVELRGEWGFTWGGDPTSAFKGKPAGFISQPGPWNRAVGEGRGQATLSLRVLIPPDAPALALSLPDVNSAFRLHLNGSPALSVGKVGGDRASEHPVLRRALVRVPQGTERLDLVLEVSNHHHFEGGISRSVVLGPLEALSTRHERARILPLLGLGALTVVMAFQLAFWAGGRRDRAFLVFALFTALMGARTFASGQLYTLLGDDMRADLWYLLPSYVTLFLFPGIYIAFLRELFPNEVPRRLFLATVGVSALAVLAVALLPSAIYTRLRDVFSLLVLLMPLLGMAILVPAVIRRRTGALWMMAGSAVFLASAVNDALHYQRIIHSTDLSSLGFAALAVAYASALALRLFNGERLASERLAALNRVLEDRVAERTRRLAEAKAAAERASQAKSEFLAMMSHEIRTPLHGWSALTELLQETALDERQKRYVAQLRATASHLNRLLGGILDMSRIEAGAVTVARVPFDLAGLVDDLGAGGRTAAEARGLAFRLEAQPGLPPHVRGDPDALRQILFNFLDNAVKFTASGSIVLSVAPLEGDVVRFAVADTGCGIPQDMRERIFEPFTQADSSIRRRHEGSGLGLSLCRHLAGLMGGRVGIDSIQGRGTTAWFEVPLPAVEAVEQRAPAGSSLPPGLRVLVADDVPLNRVVVRDFLAGAGCLVDEACDGREAVDLSGAGGYDLLVLDLRMPGVDGFQAAREIRAREAERGEARIPMVALSAGAAVADRRMAAEAGFDLFLSKPIERPALLSALAGLLAQGGEASDGLPPPPAIPDGLGHMMPAFVAEMEKDCRRLLELKDGDRKIIAEHAHAARGKAAMFGEQILFELFTTIEEDATAGRACQEDVLRRIVERCRQLAVYDIP